MFKAIKQLPENQRIAFVLIKTEGLSYSQTAQILNTTEKGIEGLMHRAKENLRKTLKAYFGKIKGMQQTPIDNIINSVEGISRATAPDFFETRLMAAMEKRLLRQNKTWWQIKQPTWIAVSLIVLLCANFYLLSFSKNKAASFSEIKTTTVASLQNFASDYQLNTDVFNY